MALTRARHESALSLEQEWERGVAPADERRGSGPVRVIPVTVAMQESDRLRRQRLESHTDPVRSTWRARVLGHRATRPAPPPKESYSAGFNDTRPAIRRQRCSGCVRSTEHASGQCWRCRQKAERAKGAVQ